MRDKRGGRRVNPPAFIYSWSFSVLQCGQLPRLLHPLQPPALRVRSTCRAAKKTATASSNTITIVAKLADNQVNILIPSFSTTTPVRCASVCAGSASPYTDWVGKPDRLTMQPQRLPRPYQYQIRRRQTDSQSGRHKAR